MKAPRPAGLSVKAAVRERRQEERQQRRAGILAAAKRVYSAKGFLGATIEEIAAAARVGVGTIYLYYKSKEDLYVSLLFESTEIFAAELKKIASSHRRADRKVRDAWSFFYRFRSEFPESYRILFLLHHQGFPAAVTPATLAELNRRTARNFAVAAAIVREAMDAGVYRQGNPREVVDVLWGMFLGLVHLCETRENLGLGIATVAELHARSFDWLETGLLRRS